MNVEMATDHWQTLSLSLLTCFLALAAWFDWRQRRVPNQVVLIALLSGLVLHAIGPQAWMRSGGLFTLAPGALGISGALLGALVALALFLPFYIMKVLGAGDVKLMAAVGAFAGPAATVNLALFVLLAGGVLALARLLLFPGKELVRANLVAMLGHLHPGATGPGFDASTQTVWRMPYAVAIAFGVLAYGAWTLSGLAPILNF